MKPAHGWKDLRGWAITEAEIRQADDGLVYVPYCNPDGTLHNRRVFAPNGRTWWETSGTGLILWGLDRLPPERDRRTRAVLVGEGESDGVMLTIYATGASHPEVEGFDVVACPGARTWRSDWRRHLEDYPLIYLLGDGDDPGRAMNMEIKNSLPWARPVWLPDGEDVRSIAQGHPDWLDPYIGEADNSAKLRAALLLSSDLDTCRSLLSGEATAHAT